MNFGWLVRNFIRLGLVHHKCGDKPLLNYSVLGPTNLCPAGKRLISWHDSGDQLCNAELLLVAIVFVLYRIYHHFALILYIFTRSQELYLIN